MILDEIGIALHYRILSLEEVSDLVRGKIDRFSIDTLVAMLGHAGVTVQFSTKRRRKVA